MSLHLNPECFAGKHSNCDGRSLHSSGDVVDNACPCTCHGNDFHEHGGYMTTAQPAGDGE